MTASTTDAEKISYENGQIKVPNKVAIPFIEGDGIGPDITRATQVVVNAAIEKAYGNEKAISWVEVMAGEKSFNDSKEWLPQNTLDIIKDHKIAIKGPLSTPTGGGIRSLNVALRQIFDLYACVRPVRYFEGVPSPVKAPEKLDVVIFRENTEDIYKGIDFEQGSDEAKKVIELLKTLNHDVRPDSGIGVKPISIFGTKRLVRKAIEYAIKHKKPSVTLVHKGNIMKYTEGAFCQWGYDLAKEEFANETISEAELWDKHNGKVPEGKVIIKDRIADAMFQQLLLRPDEYSVIASPNLNGDYLSDACAAQVGGLGIAPGANIADEIAIFEATHGTAPKYADQDKVNPGSLILSAVLMLDHLGWNEASKMIITAFAKTIQDKTVTYDLERQMDGAKLLKTSEFASAIVKNL